jgi:hypothetical protein
MNELEPVEKKICKACGVEKLHKRFTKLASGNRAGVCNICRSLGNTIKKGGSKKQPKKNIPLSLGFVQVKDYENAYKFLEKIGYKLNKKGDIHEQFCKKYGLTPNSPKEIFNNHYSPKDLGLI